MNISKTHGLVMDHRRCCRRIQRKFEEDDPNEFENREEDGWDNDNWARDLINEEYEADYEDFPET